ncbi:MAG: nucleotidyl transferase AbiEii/AbiGii toxin family protein [Candidatus Kuenenbacteria bacterium]
MDQNQLNQLIQSLKISTNQILREEAEMLFLDALAKNNLGSKVVFYGGTALRLVYGSPRFSEDIDLIQIKNIDIREFSDFIQKTINNNSNWSLRDIRDKRRTKFALILIRDEKLKHNFSLKIELHKPIDKPDLEQELSLIKSPISVLEPLLLVPGLEKLKKFKLDALAGRQKARDVFDLWYISQVLKEKFELPDKLFKYNKREFKNELQVFLPKKYYPVVDQLYERINKSNQ